MRPKTIFIFLLILVTRYPATAQSPVHRPLKVLFLGNSYTYVNSMPQVTAAIASAMGDSLIYDSNTIGGYTLQQHAHDATSLSKIGQGDLDYVVLQEQSQWPSFPIDQVDTGMFPYAHFLDSLNQAYHPCGRTMFYMTWGRKNGDDLNCPTWPPVCTYEGMDSMLRLRYMMMADSNNAVVSPAGAVWHYIRQQYPAIELYQADESHPTLEGTYAAACAFYTAFFRRDPETIPYDYTLSAADAANIRHAAKVVVYDSMLYWHIGQYDLTAGFTYSNGAGNLVTFTNTSLNATDYTWYFGDGDSSTTANTQHTYTNPGTYTVTLVAKRCMDNDTMIMTLSTWPASVRGYAAQAMCFRLSPNPAHDLLSISTDAVPPKPVRIAVFDISGKLVNENTMANANRSELNISTLPAGTYTLIATSGDTMIWRGKFLKK